MTPWPEGPWTKEPDRVEFQHAGLPCLMVRHPTLGHWCGYAAVPPGHPLHGKGADDVEIEAHGGLTYAESCQGVVCHKPALGEPDDVWWFGFDCAHFMDLSPGILRLDAFLSEDLREFRGVYRDADYVRRETEKLAEQLIAAASPAQSPDGDCGKQQKRNYF